MLLETKVTSSGRRGVLKACRLQVDLGSIPFSLSFLRRQESKRKFEM
jgi:hypothetical protein